jgi:hypothetical protein
VRCWRPPSWRWTAAAAVVVAPPPLERLLLAGQRTKPAPFLLRNSLWLCAARCGVCVSRLRNDAHQSSFVPSFFARDARTTSRLSNTHKLSLRACCVCARRRGDCAALQVCCVTADPFVFFDAAFPARAA